MNWLDLIIVISVLVFFLIGLKRGLIDQVFSVAAVIGGILSAIMLYDIGAYVLMDIGVSSNRSFAYLLSFVLIFLVCYILIQIMGWLAAKIVGGMRLGWLNRLAGGVLGVIIAVVISCFFISGVRLFVKEDSAVLKRSIFLPYVDSVCKVVKEVLPKNLVKEYKETKKVVRNKGFEQLLKLQNLKEESPKEKKIK